MRSAKHQFHTSKDDIFDITEIDKGLVTPPPLSSKEEHVQKESSSQEKPKPRATKEASKEAQVVEYVQQPSQDVEDQTTGSTETNTIEEESS